MAGSVIRPDFDWNSLINSGRVEAVLNHYGRRDLWAWVSEYFIPRSGPSGFRGFAECSGVFNCVELDFRHTTFFESEYIDDVHERLWRPFLTRPVDELQQLSRPGESRVWRPLPWVLRGNLLRVLLLIALAAGATELLLHCCPARDWARLMNNWLLVGAILVGYVAGAIPVSNIAAGIVKGVDLRRTGSGAVSPPNLYHPPVCARPSLRSFRGGQGRGRPGARRGGRPWAAAWPGLALPGTTGRRSLRGGGDRGLSTATGAIAVGAWPGAPCCARA